MKSNILKKILSIDGGGIRGILPADIIAHLERRLQLETGDENARIADFFDLLAGTSAGGILTCLYLVPDKRDDGVVRPKYSATQAAHFYSELGPVLFRKPLSYIIRSGAGLLRSRYCEDELYKFSRKILGDVWISEVMKDCLITAYDLSSRKALLFSKYSTLKYGEMADYKLCDIARSTSAAPSYFIPSRIFAKDKGSRHLVDGGVYAGNPAMCSYVEAIKIWPGEPVSNFRMLSVGTGKVIKAYHHEKTRHFGYLHWLNPILDILMSSVSETVDYQVQQIFSVSGAAQNYVRIEPPMLDADIRIDNASAKNISKLKSAAQNFIDHNSELFDSLCKTLTNEGK